MAIRYFSWVILSAFLLSSACSDNACPSEQTFNVGPDGGTYEYCNWNFEIPKDAFSKNTTFTVRKSPQVQVKSVTHAALENPTTGELEPVLLELDTDPNYATTELTIADPSALVKPDEILVCTDDGPAIVSERSGNSGSDHTATPEQPLGENPCFKLFSSSQSKKQTAGQEDTKPVFFSATTMSWSDAWDRLLARTKELADKIAGGYKLVDPCVVCSFAGFQVAARFVPSDCQNFVSEGICTATLSAVSTAVPIVLIPPLKQGICAAAKAAIVNSVNFLSAQVGGTKLNTLCDWIDRFTNPISALPESRDVLGCSFQGSCALLTTCTADSKASKWIAGNITKCEDLGF